MNYKKWIGARVVHKPSGIKFVVYELGFAGTEGEVCLQDGTGSWFKLAECRRLIKKPKRDAKILEEALEHISSELSKHHCCLKAHVKGFPSLAEHYSEIAKDALKKYRGEE